VRAESGLQPSGVVTGDKPVRLRHMTRREQALQQLPALAVQFDTYAQGDDIRGTPVQCCIQIGRGLHSEVVNTGRTPTM
jgi:hypothetical protein